MNAPVVSVQGHNNMKCLVCGEKIEREQSWKHVRSVHLEPIGLTREEIIDHARKIADPIEVRLAHVTCINLQEIIIYISPVNTELLIAFAREHGNIPWTDVVEWQILHEKAHLSCRDICEPPGSIRPYILANVEDYYINRYMIPQKYWQVCVMNARCSIEIRNISPIPYSLRDGNYYCTLAAFVAYGAATFEECKFLSLAESRFVAIISKFFKKIKTVEHISMVSNEIDKAFKDLLPQMGI
jgi:hypothetical protein